MSPGTWRVLSVVGARPNFIKLAPVARAFAERAGVEHIIVHTGQHYDDEMSDVFFRHLDIPHPAVNLGVGGGSHAQQTAAIMLALEPRLKEFAPDVVLIYGDVNSTLAAALVASKLGIAIGHVEAGLRSRDMTMPEEVNRVVADRLSALLFAPSRDACENLAWEGAACAAVHFVGNVMIDALVAHLPAARAAGVPARFGVPAGGYVVATIHRPGNVDRPDTLREVCDGLARLARERPVLFPVHPRTREAFLTNGAAARLGGVTLLDPLSYLDMIGLVADSALVVTDSGGLQEETTFLGVPCLTLRPNTERPITVECGTSRLVASRADAIVAAAAAATRRAVTVPNRWDGKAAERIAGVLFDGASYTQ